jgi:hypothetical protein
MRFTWPIMPSAMLFWGVSGGWTLIKDLHMRGDITVQWVKGVMGSAGTGFIWSKRHPLVYKYHYVLLF